MLGAQQAPGRMPAPKQIEGVMVEEPRVSRPGPGCFGEVRRAVEPRERERADARGGSRRAALNAGLGGMFVA